MPKVTIDIEGLEPTEADFPGDSREFAAKFAKIIYQGTALSLMDDGKRDDVVPYAEVSPFRVIADELKAKNALLEEKQTAKWPVHGRTGAIVSE